MSLRSDNLRIYDCWKAMKRRCTNPRDAFWKDYGGRGITICDRWFVFANFLTDMGPRPEGFQLDRINNDGDYEPMNCRWVDRFVQQAHTRKTRLLRLNGRSMHLLAWSREVGIAVETLRRRLGYGWPVEKVLSTSPELYKNRPKVWNRSVSA